MKTLTMWEKPILVTAGFRGLSRLNLHIHAMTSMIWTQPDLFQWFHLAQQVHGATQVHQARKDHVRVLGFEATHRSFAMYPSTEKTESQCLTALEHKARPQKGPIRFLNRVLTRNIPQNPTRINYSGSCIGLTLRALFFGGGSHRSNPKV